jgi:hypothetical protein
MKRAVLVLVVMAGGGAANGLVAPDAEAQQPTRSAAPAVNQADERRQFRYPAQEAVPGLTEVLDQSVRPEPPPAAAGDQRIVWPVETPFESVVTTDSEPPAAVPITTTATQSPVTRVETGTAQVPRVEVPEVKVVAPPPPPVVRIMPASPTPVVAPASSFPLLSIPASTP